MCHQNDRFLERGFYQNLNFSPVIRVFFELNNTLYLMTKINEYNNKTSAVH
jgi:hypothetical protein